MNNLPLFYYPTTYTYIDDDETLLQCINFLLAHEGRTRLFATPGACLQYFNTYQSPLKNRQFLAPRQCDEGFGVLGHSLVDFDISLLSSLANDDSRYDEVTAIVMDYQMPEMNGLLLAEALLSVPIQKILLTGAAEDNKVIEAFNRSIIHRFIQKGSADMEKQLIQHVSDFSYRYFQQMSAPLFAHLEADSVLPQSDSVFIAFFQKFCAERQVREYYLIDKQGSFLCINHAGKRFFLVIHTERSLNLWMETYGAEQELSCECVNALQSRQVIPFFGLGMEAWNVDPNTWVSCFFDAQYLEGRERYYWFVCDE